MRIATVSLDQHWEDKASNIKIIKDLMLDVIQHSPQLIVFPEMTLTSFTMNSHEMAEDFGESDTISFFSELAKQYNVNISFGVILKTNEMPTNNQIVVSNTGCILARYEKIHPFTYSRENNHYSKGSQLSTFKLGDFNIGLTICYDLRFPELYQALSNQCDAIINIANWPQKRVADWRLLLHARALENQCYIIGVNRTGTDGNGLVYEKSSAIVMPNGTDCQCIFSKDVIELYDIDVEEVYSYRESFPVKKDRRIELYKTFM